MATAIYTSLVDHSPLDGTNDAINGSEVDANPQTLAQILDGTTATDLAQDGVVDFRFTSTRAGIRAMDLDVAGAAIHYGLVVEWDPDSGNMTDGSSGVGVQFLMPDDANTQTIYGRMYVIMQDDAAASDDADFVFEAAVAGTLTTEILRFGGGGTLIYNEDSADLDMRFESNNLATLFSFDAGLDSLGIGAVATDGTIFEVTPGAATRTAVTAVGNAVNVPADTDNFDNASSTVAIYAAAALGVQTLTGDTATLTFTNAATLYIAGIPAASTNVAIANTARALWVDAGATQLDGTLTVDGLTTHGGNVVSDTDSTDNMGTTTVRWANVYTDNIGDTGQDLTILATTVNLPSGHVFDYNGADVTVTHAANTLTWAGASSGYVFNGGNVGINVSPQAWNSAFLGGVIDLGFEGSSVNTSAVGQIAIGGNAYYDVGGAWTYATTAVAALNQVSAGTHVLQVAASGTADTDITWITALQITNAGAVKNVVDSQGYYTGAGDDLRVYHDGTNNLWVGAVPNYFRGSSFTIQNAAATENLLTAVVDGAVTAYYDNAAKLATTTDGIDVTGEGYFSAGVKIGADALNNLIDDASGGTGSTVLYIGTSTIDVTASDVRWKMNITTANDAPREHLKTLAPLVREYDYRDGSGHFAGLLAQDVLEVLPQYVIGVEDSRSLRYHYMIGPLLWGWENHDSRIARLERMMN